MTNIDCGWVPPKAGTQGKMRLVLNHGPLGVTAVLSGGAGIPRWRHDREVLWLEMGVMDEEQRMTEKVIKGWQRSRDEEGEIFWNSYFGDCDVGRLRRGKSIRLDVGSGISTFHERWRPENVYEWSIASVDEQFRWPKKNGGTNEES